MVATRQLTPKKGEVLLLVGTLDGLFVFRAGKSRARWDRPRR